MWNKSKYFLTLNNEEQVKYKEKLTLGIVFNFTFCVV